MTRQHAYLYLALLLIGNTSIVVATTTICPTSVAKRYHYGQKASLRFDVGRQGPESITDEVKEFAAGDGLTYASVGLKDPGQDPPQEELDQILQDNTSGEILIMVTTSNRTTIAAATIETSSYSCGPTTKDWRPYWRAFKAFVRAKGYRTEGD
jgi:hypothetical protein